jgi:hypothetical protein
MACASLSQVADAENSGGFGEGCGQGGLEVGGRKDPLGLAERGAEGVREDPEGGDVLLEFGDPDRKGLRSGVEGGKVPFEFGRAVDEAGDIGEEVGSQRGLGAAQLEAGSEGEDRRDERDERAREYQDDHDRPHGVYGSTETPSFTNRAAVLDSQQRRGVEQSGSSSGS